MHLLKIMLKANGHAAFRRRCDLPLSAISTSPRYRMLDGRRRHALRQLHLIDTRVFGMIW